MTRPDERGPLAVAAALGAVSVAVVIAVAAGAVPRDALPRLPALLDAIPHVNAVLSLAAVPTIAVGWRRIHRGDVAGHRRAMALALALFVAFLGLYLYKVAVEGPTAFQGPQVVGRYLYLPLLAVHILLAVVCVPLVYAAVALAIAVPTERLGATRHPHIGRIAAPLWILAFGLGVLVYLLLYWAY